MRLCHEMNYLHNSEDNWLKHLLRDNYRVAIYWQILLFQTIFSFLTANFHITKTIKI